jgi:hypothetical protein
MPGHIFWKATEKMLQPTAVSVHFAHRFELTTYGILNDVALFICIEKKK